MPVIRKFQIVAGENSHCINKIQTAFTKRKESFCFVIINFHGYALQTRAPNQCWQTEVSGVGNA